MSHQWRIQEIQHKFTPRTQNAVNFSQDLQIIAILGEISEACEQRQYQFESVHLQRQATHITAQTSQGFAGDFLAFYRFQQRPGEVETDRPETQTSQFSAVAAIAASQIQNLRRRMYLQF